MARFIVAIFFALLTFALSKSNNPKEEKPKIENGTEVETAQGRPLMKGDDQDNSKLRSDLDKLDMAELMNKCNESFRIEMAYLQSLNESGSFLDETDKTPKVFTNPLSTSIVIVFTQKSSNDMPVLDELFYNMGIANEPVAHLMCFVRCMLVSTGVMSDAGELDPARAALVFAGERNGRTMDIGDMATTCATNRQETCRCEKAYNFMRCVMSMEIEKYGSAQ